MLSIRSSTSRLRPLLQGAAATTALAYYTYQRLHINKNNETIQPAEQILFAEENIAASDDQHQRNNEDPGMELIKVQVPPSIPPFSLSPIVDVFAVRSKPSTTIKLETSIITATNRLNRTDFPASSPS